MIIDVFPHIVPQGLYERYYQSGLPGRWPGPKCQYDLGVRFRVMDRVDNYKQVLTVPISVVDVLNEDPDAKDLARLANDGMAELVQKHPKRFPAFIASLPMNDPKGLLKEAKRAIKDLGAVGVQIFTNVLGKPLTTPETMPLFDLMAKLDLPIWLHPARGADFPDYAGEKKSHYEIWWTFGWPYETSVAMAHMVFAGLFDQHPGLKIITHHMGGMVPYFEGRVGPGWDQLGTRTSDVDYTRLLKKLNKRPLDYFRMFYADTALFGAWEATKCGLKFFGVDHVLFASDAPFDPEKGSMYTRTTIEIIDRLDLSPDERSAIYEGNARRLMKLGAS